tara:strand:+ start:349 stop:957 length:609 start_codon:yes stop_codon:yes gene_type:complete
MTSLATNTQTPNTQTQQEPMDVDESPFATVLISIDDLWTAEYADAINKITTSPEEPNTLYKYMTEKQWNNAHWNEGDGQNLPYNCKNKYLQLNAGGKTKWQEDNLKQTINYTLRFYKIPATKELPDEIIKIGENWIMKLIDDSLETEDVWMPHRICGEIIIGVLMPRQLKSFNINTDLGDKIQHLEQPKTSFEFRGIYGVRS